MTPAERCDEIIKMIDEVLDGTPRPEPGSVGALARSGALDRPLVSTALEDLA